jgi:hypothetical protein
MSVDKFAGCYLELVKHLTDVCSEREDVGPFDGEDAVPHERCQGRREDRGTLDDKSDDGSQKYGDVPVEKANI